MISEIKNQYISSDKKLWFALRVSYNRETKLQKHLEELGHETFIPMIVKETEQKGILQRKLKPAISNLLFVNILPDEMETIRRDPRIEYPVRYIIDHATNGPTIVPDKQMQNFMRISKLNKSGCIYLSNDELKLKKGTRVRVLSGIFKGVEGEFIRIKRDRKVVVNIPGLMAIATTFVAPDQVEILENQTNNDSKEPINQLG